MNSFHAQAEIMRMEDQKRAQPILDREEQMWWRTNDESTKTKWFNLSVETKPKRPELVLRIALPRLPFLNFATTN